MDSVSVLVLKDHEYDQKKRKVGETYLADQRFLHILTGLGRVKVVEVSAEPQKPEQGRYNRRDMRAAR